MSLQDVFNKIVGVKPTGKPAPAPKPKAQPKSTVTKAEMDKFMQAVNPKPKPAPKPAPEKTDYQKFLGATQGYEPNPKGPTYTQQRQKTPGTLENDMTYFDKSFGPDHKARNVARHVLYNARNLGIYSESEIAQIRQNTLKAIKSGNLAPLKDFVKQSSESISKRDRKQELQSKMDDLKSREGNALAQMQDAGLVQDMYSPDYKPQGVWGDIVNNITRSYAADNPDLANRSDAQLAIDSIVNVTNPVTSLMTLGTGKGQSELSETDKIIGMVGDMITQAVVAGGAGSAAKGIPSLAEKAIAFSALDAPQFIQILQNGGIQGVGEILKKTIDPNATPSERIGGAMLAFSIVAGGAGSIAKLKTHLGERAAAKVAKEAADAAEKALPSLGDTPEAAKVARGVDEIKASIGSALTDFENAAPPKPARKPRAPKAAEQAPQAASQVKVKPENATVVEPKAPRREPAKFEPKADPNYQAGDVPDIRKGLKPEPKAPNKTNATTETQNVQKPTATQKEPWEMKPKGAYIRRDGPDPEMPSNVYEHGPFWVEKAGKVFKVWESGLTHSEKRGAFGDLNRAKQWVDDRIGAGYDSPFGREKPKAHTRQPAIPPGTKPSEGGGRWDKPADLPPTAGTGTRKHTTEAPRLVANRVGSRLPAFDDIVIASSPDGKLQRVVNVRGSDPDGYTLWDGTNQFRVSKSQVRLATTNEKALPLGSRLKDKVADTLKVERPTHLALPVIEFPKKWRGKDGRIDASVLTGTQIDNYLTRKSGDNASYHWWRVRADDANQLSRVRTKSDPGWHYKVVQKALSEGKPVPAEVLADYPDLAKKYGKPNSSEIPEKSAKAKEPVGKKRQYERVGDVSELGFLKNIEQFNLPTKKAVGDAEEMYNEAVNLQPDQRKNVRLKWLESDPQFKRISGIVDRYRLNNPSAPMAYDDVIERLVSDRTFGDWYDRFGSPHDNPAPLVKVYNALVESKGLSGWDIKQPRTKADIKADIKKAFDDLGKGPNVVGANIPFSPQQIDALGRLVKHSVELGYVTAKEAITYLKQEYGNRITPAMQKHIRDNWDASSGQLKAETAETPTSKVAAEPKAAKDTQIVSTPKPDMPATGLANRFDIPERAAKGKERVPGKGFSANELADQGMKAYTDNPHNAPDLVKKYFESREVPSKEHLNEIAAYKRSLVNEQLKIADAATDPLSPEHARYKTIDTELDKISEVAQLAKTEFHGLGMSFQVAFTPDFSYSELVRKAKVYLGGEVPKHIEAKFKDLEIKYAQALKDMDALKAKIEANARTWSGKTGGERLRSSAAARLQKMGLQYKGKELAAVGPTGGLGGSKKRGAIQLSFSPDMGTEIAKYARGIVYEEGFHGMDDLIRRIQNDFPQLSEEQILGSLSGEYRKASVQASVQMMEARKIMNSVKRMAEYRNKSLAGKIGANAGELLNGTIRAFQTGADLSAPFIQGKTAMITHPKEWAKSWAPMLKAAAKGEEFAAEHYAKIVNDPRYAAAKKAGLEISMPGGSFSAQEEMFAGAIVSRMSESKIPGIRQIGKIIKHSEAAFTVFMNNLRWEIYTKIAALDPSDPHVAHDAARMVNIMTGKGHGKIARALNNNLAASIVYAPRYTLSKVQFAAEPISILSGAYKSKIGKKVAAANYAKAVGAMVLTTIGVEMLGGKVDKDPRSTDYMKWALPNGVTVNIFGDVAEPVRLASQLLYGRIAKSGRYTEAGNYNDDDIWKILERKASPTLKTVEMLRKGTYYDSGTGKDVPARPKDLLIQNFTPIGLRQTISTLADSKASSAEKYMSLLQVLGIDSSKTVKKKTNKVPPMRVPPGARRILTGK